MKKIVVEFCGKCGVRLNDNNWFASFRKGNSGTCKRCANQGYSILYCVTCGNALENGRCIACDAKRTCTKCGALLTEENWGNFNRKRFLLRCNACHYEITGAWQRDNPEVGRAKTRRWRDRNPEHASEYYHKNKERLSQVAIEYLWKMKADAVAKLGGKCVACGIEDLRVLQINHLNGRSNKRECGQRIYKPILDGTRGIDDLDVRCANCNVIYEYERGNRRTPVWFGLDEDTPDDTDMIEDFLKEE